MVINVAKENGTGSKKITTDIKNCILHKNWEFGKWCYRLSIMDSEFKITEEEYIEFKKLMEPEKTFIIKG